MPNWAMWRLWLSLSVAAAAPLVPVSEAGSVVLLLYSCKEIPTTANSVRHQVFSKFAADVTAANYSLFLLLDDMQCSGACATVVELTPTATFECLPYSTLGTTEFTHLPPGSPMDASPMPQLALRNISGPWWFKLFWGWEHGVHLALSRPDVINSSFVWIFEADVVFNGNWGELMNRYDQQYSTIDLLGHEYPYHCRPGTCYGSDPVLGLSRLGNLLEEAGTEEAADVPYKMLLFASRLSRRLVHAGVKQFALGKRALAEVFWPTVCQQSWGLQAVWATESSSKDEEACNAHPFNEDDVGEWAVRPNDCSKLALMRKLVLLGNLTQWEEGKLTHPFKIEELSETSTWIEYLEGIYRTSGGDTDCRSLGTQEYLQQEAMEVENMRQAGLAISLHADATKQQHPHRESFLPKAIKNWGHAHHALKPV